MSILSRNVTLTERSNQKLFKLLSLYLNLASDYIDKSMIEGITCGDKDGEDFAYANLVAAACGLDIFGNKDDKHFFRSHFLPCFKRLDVSDFENDPYYKNIKFPNENLDKWNFSTRVCKAYEAFVYDDPVIMPDGRILPRIGFFDCDYHYPAVFENGREWMTLMPNEKNTTFPAVRRAKGNVLTYGLGLGYFTYLASLKEEVSSVTVVERSRDAIKLFERIILPQFPDPEKIRIIEMDAFEFAEKSMANGHYNMVFTDIWHDSSDGCNLYLKMKKYEPLLPDADFVYWVEDTLKLYI